jgi:hypothetical protein
MLVIIRYANVCVGYSGFVVAENVQPKSTGSAHSVFSILIQ